MNNPIPPRVVPLTAVTAGLFMTLVAGLKHPTTTPIFAISMPTPANGESHHTPDDRAPEVPVMAESAVTSSATVSATPYLITRHR